MGIGGGWVPLTNLTSTELLHIFVVFLEGAGTRVEREDCRCGFGSRNIQDPKPAAGSCPSVGESLAVARQ